jgi:hypothetical protein
MSHRRRPGRAVTGRRDPRAASPRWKAGRRGRPGPAHGTTAHGLEQAVGAMRQAIDGRRQRGRRRAGGVSCRGGTVPNASGANPLGAGRRRSIPSVPQGYAGSPRGSGRGGYPVEGGLASMGRSNRGWVGRTLQMPEDFFDDLSLCDGRDAPQRPLTTTRKVARLTRRRRCSASARFPPPTQGGRQVAMAMANIRLRSLAQLQRGEALLTSGPSTPCWRGVGVIEPRRRLWAPNSPHTAPDGPAVVAPALPASPAAPEARVSYPSCRQTRAG